MDTNNLPNQSQETSPQPFVPQLNQSSNPISKPEINQNPNQPHKYGKTILFTLVSLVILASIVIFTLYLYIQNRQSSDPSTQKLVIATTPTPAQKTAPIPSGPYVPTTTVEKEMAENLKKYGVVCKRFTELNEALKNPEIVCVLDLSDQKMTSVPAEIYLFKNLNSIDLSNNKISTIPQKLIDMPNIVSINLSNNNISSIIGIKNKTVVIPSDPQASSTPPVLLQALNLSENNISKQDQQALRTVFESGMSNKTSHIVIF